jgi:hypothetical protein
VTYGRSIFSERHYVKRLFEPAEMKKPFSLNRFVQQDSVGERDSVKDPSKRVVRILNRGISPKVDTFLDMLVHLPDADNDNYDADIYLGRIRLRRHQTQVT